MLMQREDSTLKQAKHKKHAITAFVGDGMNDCVVLKSADIGISIGTKHSHNDINKESADIILTNLSPLGIVHAVKIAKKIQTITLQNIAFLISIPIFIIYQKIKQGLGRACHNIKKTLTIPKNDEI